MNATPTAVVGHSRASKTRVTCEFQPHLYMMKISLMQQLLYAPTW